MTTTTIGLLSFTLLIRLCLGSMTVSQLLTQELFTPLSLTNYHAWLYLSHFSTQSHNSNWFTHTRRARSRAPDRSVTCSSHTGLAIGRSTKARSTPHKTTDRSSIALYETDSRKSERVRLLHWPLPDESKIFRHETNSRTSARRSNRRRNKQANDKQAKANQHETYLQSQGGKASPLKEQRVLIL